MIRSGLGRKVFETFEARYPKASLNRPRQNQRRKTLNNGDNMGFLFLTNPGDNFVILGNDKISGAKPFDG